MKYVILVFTFLVTVFTSGEILNNNSNLEIDENKMESINNDLETNDTTSNGQTSSIKMLKDVGEAYMDNFGLTEEDFKIMKNANIDVIQSNFDICASDEDVQNFLKMSEQYGIKVVMPAGSGEAEWGYECNKESYPNSQKPVWQKSAVVNWINKWKNSSSIYAWDISNEAGSVFPNASEDKMLTSEQLKQAYKDVKETDPNHPVMIRMNGWYFYDYEDNFFRKGNPFEKDISDIVMVNTYSNVEDYFPDFVTTVTTRSIYNIQQIDPDTSVIISLGVWEEKPLWVKPTEDNLQRDISQLRDKDILGVAFFKYGAKGSEWYLPDSNGGAPELLKAITDLQL